jgi:GTP cyclohydrolase I
MKGSSIAQSIKNILIEIGEDTNREGLRETPERASRALLELCKGYSQPSFELKTFSSNYSGLISRPFIPFTSLCEHHILPYCGVIHFSYMPNGKVVGASKILRFMEHYTSRLTIQEELTDFLLNEFMRQVQPKGAMIIIEGHHLCEACRGIKVLGVPFVTQSVRGDYFKNTDMKEEFQQTILRHCLNRSS